MALLLLAGLWSANYLLPLLRLVRTYWHSPLRGVVFPRFLGFFIAFILLSYRPGFEENLLNGNQVDFRESHDEELDWQGVRFFEALIKADMVRLEKGVSYKDIRPEIAFALATVLRTVRESGGKTRIYVSSVNDRNHTFNNFHHRNLAVDFPIAKMGVPPARGLRFARKLSRRLGPDYRILFGSSVQPRHLHIQYEGAPWTPEQVMVLPLLDASVYADVDAALLLGWAKTVSNFDSRYDDYLNHVGMLGLPRSFVDSLADGDSLSLSEYLRAGAQLLATRLAVLGGDTAVALASIWLDVKKTNQVGAPWWLDPVVSPRVDQILIESRNFRRRLTGGSIIEADSILDLADSTESLDSLALSGTVEFR